MRIIIRRRDWKDARILFDCVRPRNRKGEHFQGPSVSSSLEVGEGIERLAVGRCLAVLRSWTTDLAEVRLDLPRPRIRSTVPRPFFRPNLDSHETGVLLMCQ